MIVRLEADGAVVAEADDCSAVHVESGLDRDDLRTALVTTGTGALTEPGAGGGAPDTPEVVLDLAVLRSRARLLTPAPDGTERCPAMGAAAGDRPTAAGRALRVPVERR